MSPNLVLCIMGADIVRSDPGLHERQEDARVREFDALVVGLSILRRNNVVGELAGMISHA